MSRYTIVKHRSRSRIGILSLETVTSMQSVDTLVEARWVIPVEPEGVVLEHHTVAIDDGRIGAILPLIAGVDQVSGRMERQRVRGQSR